MRKRRCGVVLTVLAMAITGVGAGTASAAGASPASFVEMTETWNGTAVIRLWWNTSNGGIHAELYDSAWHGSQFVGMYTAGGTQLNATGDLGPGPTNTSEVFVDHVKGCGQASSGFFCTGST